MAARYSVLPASSSQATQLSRERYYPECASAFTQGITASAVEITNGSSSDSDSAESSWTHLEEYEGDEVLVVARRLACQHDDVLADAVAHLLVQHHLLVQELLDPLEPLVQHLALGLHLALPPLGLEILLDIQSVNQSRDLGVSFLNPSWKCMERLFHLLVEPLLRLVLQLCVDPVHHIFDHLHPVLPVQERAEWCPVTRTACARTVLDKICHAAA
eukprot:3781521-Rhodomonas_salina.9